MTFLAGSVKMLQDAGIAAPEIFAAGALVFVVRNGACLGHIEVTDTVKADAREAVAALKSRGLKVSMLSGDRKEAVASVAEAVGVDGFEAELLPEPCGTKILSR